jgi:hypothetical protein
MSQLFETFRCGDGEALVAFVYGESTAAEREAITSHIARCASCAEEVAALGSTRQQLAAWASPDQALGFRITRADAVATGEPLEAPAANILRPAAWWSRPLPAWAQMAAAILIFTSGMALGGAWSSTPAATPVAAPSTGMTTIRTSSMPAPAVVTRQDLAQVERQLRAEIAQVRTAAASDPSAGDSRAVMQRVSQLIAASEARQQKELDFRTSVLATDLANARRIDNANFEQRLRGTDSRVISNQRTINSVVNSLAQPVGYTPGYSPFVP